MNVTRTFQFSIYGLAALAGVMLWLAEGSVSPQTATVPLVVLGYFFTERWGVIRLSVLFANCLGVLAFAWAGFEFFEIHPVGYLFLGEELIQPDLEATLLSACHLIVYLSWILLFMQKRARQYWWMCALGVLQVALGSLLTNTELYGFLLIVFMFSAIWTLSLFSLQQAQLRFAQTGESARIAPAADGGGLTERRSRQRILPLSRLSLRAASTARGSIQLDPNMRWISLRFVFATLGTAGLAMTMATCFFLFIPRLWARNRSIESRGSTSRIGAVSGFTPVVRLGDFGEILESTARVLEVRLFETQTNEPLDVEDYTAQFDYAEPLFRGAALDHYENGTWSSTEETKELTEIASEPFEGGATSMVRQEFQLEPIGTNLLFAISPVEAVKLSNLDHAVEVSRTSGMLYRSQDTPSGQPISYSAYSRRWRVGDPRFLRIEYFNQSVEGTVVERYTQLPPSVSARLKDLAHDVAGWEDRNKQKPRPNTMAERIRDYLRDSGEFSYSLDSSIQDPTIDPVEDFLFNRKKGHCEYFASALTLMLRAVDIPARLISGFKGGEINEISGHFEVEQRHAHAWVEAHLGDRWETLDATPAAARAESVESIGSDGRTARNLASYVQTSWSRYIVNMDYQRQYSQFYTPLLHAAKDWWEDYGIGSEQYNSTKAAMRSRFSGMGGFGKAVAALAVLVVVFVPVALFLFSRGSPALRRRLATLFGRRPSVERALVEFYERFRKLCEDRGLSRESSETQLEFAAGVRQRLNEPLTEMGLTDFPAELVDAFYSIRFGRLELSAQQNERIRESLARLERALPKENGQAQKRTRKKESRPRAVGS